MSSRTIDKPRPVPLAPLVVKNGSKICFAMISGNARDRNRSPRSFPAMALIRRVPVPFRCLPSRRRRLRSRLVRARVSASGSAAIRGSAAGILRLEIDAAGQSKLR